MANKPIPKMPCRFLHVFNFQQAKLQEPSAQFPRSAISYPQKQLVIAGGVEVFVYEPDERKKAFGKRLTRLLNDAEIGIASKRSVRCAHGFNMSRAQTLLGSASSAPILSSMHIGGVYTIPTISPALFSLMGDSSP